MASIMSSEDRAEMDQLSDMAYRLAGESGTIQEDLAKLREAFTHLFFKFPNLAKNYVETVRMRSRDIFKPKFVIGDVEPRDQLGEIVNANFASGAAGWNGEAMTPDPLALDYVVGEVNRPVRDVAQAIEDAMADDWRHHTRLGPCVSVGVNAGVAAGNLNRGCFDDNSR
jgi:hypothetical protein